ncbi:MAG: hypothetical protein KDC98_16005 [Planctomycetes bacterium]|nr:hypothetical protein [Planctomycetota bacterium]
MIRREAIPFVLAAAVAMSACSTMPVGGGPVCMPSVSPATTHPSPQQRMPRLRDALRLPDSRTEFLLGGSGTSDDRLRAGGAQLAGTLGYFVTDELELAVRQNLSTSKTGADTTQIWDAATRFAIDYHFPLENVYPQVTPYVGLNLGYIYGDSVTETMAAGPEIGIKYFVKPDVFLQFGAEYEFNFKSSDRLDRAFQNGAFFYGLGFGICFQ